MSSETLKKLLLDTKSLLDVTRHYEKEIPGPIEISLPDNTRLKLWDTGVLCCEPSQPGNKAIIISSGVHGNETAPIEICDQLIQEILSDKLIIKNPVLFIIGDPVAMNLGQRFCDENLNRLFCGKHKGKTNYEAGRAEQLEKYVERFFSKYCNHTLYHYDLHTAIRGSKYKKFIVYPFPDGREWSKQQLQFFLASDINTVLFGHQPSGTFSYHSSHHYQAHAFTVELGRVRPFGENDMTEFAKITHNLRALINNEKIEMQTFDNQDFNLFQVHHELIRQSDDEFKLNIDDDIENFTEFKAGFKLIDDIDGGYTINHDGEAIVFPNARIPKGQRVGLIVTKTSI